MIDEMRRVRTELDNRRHFTPEKEDIQLTREFVDNWTIPKEAANPETVAAKSAMNLRMASDADLFEMG